MASSAPPDSSTTSSSTPTTATAANPNMSPTFADQSQSRLLTLPKELRNKIYALVLCENPTHVWEPIAYNYTDFNADWAQVPEPVLLYNFAPPSKDCLLPCCQLYAEMKHMHTAAYRAYWTSNSFLYTESFESFLSGNNAGVLLPPDKDMKRIHEFRILLFNDYHLRIVFNDCEEPNWKSSLLRADGGVPRFQDMGMWVVAQGMLQDALTGYAGLMPSAWYLKDPRVGQGIDRHTLVAISRHDEVFSAIECLCGYLREHP